MGDNLNDFTTGADTSPTARLALEEEFAAWWGTRWIVTPNPSYGGWEGALHGFDWGASEAEQRRRKLEHLAPWR